MGSAAGDQGHGDGALETLIARPSGDGTNAIKTFTYDAGLKCDLWAAEPMLANPVCFTQDEKGRWYVAETFRQNRGVVDIRGHGTWLDDDIASKSVGDRLWLSRKRVLLTLIKRRFVILGSGAFLLVVMVAVFPKRRRVWVAAPALVLTGAFAMDWHRAFSEQFEAHEDRIRRVEDTTGSGHADRATVFADGFRDALDGTGAGLIARGNDVWFTCIPSLWRLENRDGDGSADRKEKLLTGFGIRFAYIGHDMHGLRFGPDGKLYFSIGDRALNVKTKEGTRVTETQSGSILRCNPDGSGFEVFATGMRNPQELAFDERGNLWTCDNDSDAGDASRFMYLAEGGDGGWREAFQYLPSRGPWMTERPWDEKAGPGIRYVIPPVMNVSNGPSGLTYNPGTGLSARYRNQFFLSDFRGGATASVVHQIGVEPKGAFFTGTHRDFVKGILTTDVEFGNDGSLYVLDWVESWGGSGKGRIYRFTDPSADSALQAETERLIREGMGRRGDPELAALMGHADRRVRQAAQFELVGRGPASAAALARIAADTSAPNPLTRLHGIWGLGQLGAKEAAAANALPALLADGDAEVRAQTAKVVGDLRMAGAGDRLAGLLRDPESRVRYFAALSLGKIGHPSAFESLCAMLAENDDRDPILRHGGIMGLAGCATDEQLARKTGDPTAAVRGAAVVALRRLKSPLAAAFLQDPDESVLLEAARAIHDVPIEAAMPALAALTAGTVQNPRVLTRAVNANYRLGQAANARALVALAVAATAPEAARREALEALGAWAHPNEKDRVLNQWRPIPNRGSADAAVAVTAALPGILRDAPATLQEAVIKTVTNLRIAAAAEPLLQVALSGTSEPRARAEAIRALAALKDAARLSQAAGGAVNDDDAGVRTQGMLALAAVDAGAAVRMAEKSLSGGSVREMQCALPALSEIKNRDSTRLLGGLLDQLLSKTLPEELQLDVIEAAQRHGGGDLRDKLARYAAALSPNDDLAKWRPALAGGDVESGRRIFREKVETGCLRCHKCEVGESQVGPELTHIGATKTRAYLLESIVHPDKRIAEGFETVVLTLKDGRVVAGTLAGEGAGAVRVSTITAQGQAEIVTVPFAQIEDRRRAPSPMPASLAEFLSASEMRDLVEYLASRK